MKQIPGCDRCAYYKDLSYTTKCNNPKSSNYQQVPSPNQKACVSAEIKEIKEPSVVTRMRHNVKAYNNRLSLAFIRKMTPLELLHHVHFSDRREFAIELTKNHIVSTEDVVEYLLKS